MAIALVGIRDNVETALFDSTNLVWSTDVIDQAIRSALGIISHYYGEELTLNGLDGAAASIIEDKDGAILTNGAIAYCLEYRITDRYEEATPDRENIYDLVKHKNEVMELFNNQLILIKKRKFELSTDSPNSEWELIEPEGY